MPSITRPVLVLLVLVGLLGAPRAHAEDKSVVSEAKPQPSWTGQVDPLTFALGFVHLQLEYAFDPSWSIYVGPSMKLFPGILAEDDDIPYVGLGAEVGFRFYWDAHAPEGWWVLLRGVLAELKTTRGPEQTSVGGYVSALVGYTAIFGGRFVLSGGLGIQYLDYTVGNAGPKGVLPAAHTTIGVAF